MESLADQGISASERLMRRRGVLHDGETIGDAVYRAASVLLEMDEDLSGQPDPKFAATVDSLLRDGVVVFGTALLANAGRDGAVTASCTVLPLTQARGLVDEAGFAAQSWAALKTAMGTGYDLSDLPRPQEALPRLNSILELINQRLVAAHRRPVASMATLRADHPQVREFMRAKRDVDFAKWRFNISLFVDDELFRAAEDDKPWHLFDHTGRIVDSIDAGELLAEIAECAHYCGEPGIIFKDRLEADNPTPQWPYVSTAPCAEVAMAPGEACHFGYVNLAGLVRDGSFDAAKFAAAVRVVTRLLDASVEQTIRNGGNLQLSLVHLKRRIGVGLTGFADMLIAMEVPYDSACATQLAGNLSELVEYQSKTESVRLARTRGAFPAFLGSRYSDLKWVQRKLSRSTGAVAADDWRRLFSDISEFGLRHAVTTAMPPAETPSAIVDSSTSLEPNFSLTDGQGRLRPAVRASLVRAWGEPAVARREAQWRSAEIAALDGTELDEFPYLRTAGQINPHAHLAIQAAFQSFLDDAVAKTINLSADAMVDDVREALRVAYEDGLKGIAVFRHHCLVQRRTPRD